MDELCDDCPNIGYPTDKTRCLECPRRDCDNRQSEMEEAQHQDEMRQLEEREMEDHFRRHPHG